MAAFTIDTEIGVPKRAVWRVFSGLSVYENWNPFIVEAVGTIRQDVDLALRIVTPSGDVKNFRPHVELVDSGNSVRWSTGNILFSRHTTFTLDETTANSTKFTVSVAFHGLLSNFKKGFVDELEGGYRSMAEALKKESEQRAAPPAESDPPVG